MALAAGTQAALAADAPALSAMPPVRHHGDIAYVTGGIGESESTAMKQAMHRYPLSLEFFGKADGGNEYLADIPVAISDNQGKEILKARAQGPFMLVSLPDGKYTVSSRYNGVTQRRVVDIGPASHAVEMFDWTVAS